MFELKTEDMRINERLKRINIKKDINYINSSHSDINDPIIIKNQKNIINFNNKNNIGNITFFKNNYRKYKSPSPIRKFSQNNINNNVIINRNNDYNITNDKKSYRLDYSPQQRQVARPNLNKYIIMNNYGINYC